MFDSAIYRRSMLGRRNRLQRALEFAAQADRLPDVHLSRSRATLSELESAIFVINTIIARLEGTSKSESESNAFLIEEFLKGEVLPFRAVLLNAQEEMTRNIENLNRAMSALNKGQ